MNIEFVYYKILNIILLILFLPSLLIAQQLAFPKAEGFGRFAIGGTYGGVYFVTNLNNSGPGSFRAAVSEPNRIVIFKVSGVIELESPLVVSSYITIAGQTAPGEGITIYGEQISYTNANNTITRYIRYRLGRINKPGQEDAVGIASGHDMIFDHVSITWGTDGTFDINGDVSDVTIQNSIIGQGLRFHSTGGLIQSTGGISILRCLYINNKTRNPKVKGVNQYINNVVYNWMVAGYILGDSQRHSEAIVRNNYFIAGPATQDLPFNRANKNFYLYADNNWYDNNLNGKLDGHELGREAYGPVTWVEESFGYFPSVTVRSPQEAYHWVVNNVGTLPRTKVDQALINQLISLGKKGRFIENENELPTNGPGNVTGGESPVDKDHDGMADEWELRHGLNPSNKFDYKIINDNGYTNLEIYLHYLANKKSNLS